MRTCCKISTLTTHSLIGNNAAIYASISTKTHSVHSSQHASHTPNARPLGLEKPSNNTTINTTNTPGNTAPISSAANTLNKPPADHTPQT